MLRLAPRIHAGAPPFGSRVTTPDLDAIRQQLRAIIRGKQDAIDLVLTAVLAGGHVLLEDVPGVGKTTLAKAVARVFDVRFARSQFTSDLLPSDILGVQILNPKDGTLSFQQGPIFANIFLADEINRASPRTQSALLEAMNEGQVTLDGTTHPVPQPFSVIATQNPADFQGTYPLPEAQLDRFWLRLSLGYPDQAHELNMLSDRQRRDPLDGLNPLWTADRLTETRTRVRETHVDETVKRYALSIVRSTRQRAEVAVGVSPRGGLMLVRTAQAFATLQGRDYVTPDDVQRLAIPVLAHRLKLQRRTANAATASHVIQTVIEELPIPT